MKNILNTISIIFVFIVLSSCNNFDMLVKETPKPIIPPMQTKATAANDSTNNVPDVEIKETSTKSDDKKLDLANIGKNLSKNINNFFKKESTTNDNVAAKSEPVFDFNSKKYIGAQENDLQQTFGKADFIAQDKSTKIYQYFSDQCTVAFYLNDFKGAFEVVYIDIRHRHHFDDLDVNARADCAKIALSHRYYNIVKES